jgi:hypothetical protein
MLDKVRPGFLAVSPFVLGCLVAACSANSGNNSGESSGLSSGGTSASSGGALNAGGNVGSGGASAGGGTVDTGGGTADTGGAAGGGGLPAFDAGTDPARNQVAKGAVCDRIATIQCAGEQHCCNAPGRTFDECKTVMQKGCTDAYLDAVSANSYFSAYNTTAAEPIFAQFEQLASNCDPSVTAWGAGVGGLRALFPGTVAPGANALRRRST